MFKAETGLGKSTIFLHNLFKLFPNFKIICSQITVVNAQDLAINMANLNEDLILGENVGFITGQKKI